MTTQASWITCTLGDCVNLVSGGTPSKKRPDFWGGTIPWVSSKDLKVPRIYSTPDRLTALGSEAPGAKLVPRGTILIVVRSMILAKEFPVTMTMRDVAFNQDLKAVIPRDGVDIRFLYYWLLATAYEIRGIVDEAAHGTKRIQTDRLLAQRVALPPESTQRSIAKIFWTIDDLIENNTRRIAILEEMAQAIYREWFVHFRFPGHENVELVDSEVGLIPEGWNVRGFGDVSDNFDRLRKPLSKLVRAEMQGEYPYYGAARVFDYVNDYIFDGKYLLVGEDGSVITGDGYPVLQLTTGKFWANNHTHVVQGRASVFTEYLYLALSTTPIAPYMTGAAQPKVTQGNLNRIPILVANDDLLGRFRSHVEPMFDLIHVLTAQVSVFTEQRDLLLPRLVSGEIDVSKLDIDTGELVA